MAAAQLVEAQGATTASGRGEIRGRAVNAANKAPVPNATVEVTLAGSTTASSRVTAGADGLFRVPGLRLGRYHALVRALGYRPVDVQSIDITTASTRVDIGDVALTSAPLELQAVEVVVHRPDVLLAPDRNSYVVRDIPTAKGGNALDVLRTIPAIDVDIDNVVSLRGNSGVTVQVNGRPSPLKPAQLGDYLAQLPADMVDKVEVIPNPSARDDPTGVAGIINIVLKEEADAGTSGGVTVAGSTKGQANAGVNVGYEHKALTLYGSYGFLRDDRPRNELLFRENDYLTPLTFLDESTLRTQKRQIHTLTGSLGYKLNSHEDLSLDLVASTRHDDETGAIAYRTLNTSRSLIGLADRISSGSNRENDLDGTLGLKHAFAQKGHKFSAELRGVLHSEGGPSVYSSRNLSLTGAPLAITDQETQQNLERPQESSVKLDYVRPLRTGLRMEMGYKGAFSHFHTALDTRVPGPADAYVIDPTRTSDFQYQQDVNAAYAMVTGQTGNLQFQGGLRGEHAATEFRVASVSTPFANHYNNVFPSGLLSYHVDENTQVKISYSARIRRPDDGDQLDPIPHYQDPLNLSRGNPYLTPEHTSAYELGLQRSMGKTTFQLTPFFRRTFDAVRSLRTIDSLGVTTRTFANIATSDSYGGDATLAQGGTRLSGFVGSSLYRQVTNANNVAANLSLRTSGWRVRANGAFRVSKTMDVQALLSYQAAVAVEQGTNGSRTQVNFAARQKLMDDQLSLTLRVIDPFDTAHERGTTFDPRFYQTSDRSRPIRGLLLSASWTFGKPQKDDKVDLVSDTP